MLLAMSFAPILSSAVANDDQLGPPFTLTLSSPFNQAAMHSIRHFLTFPLQFSSIAPTV